MKLCRLHSWTVTPREAVALQIRMRDLLDLSRPLGRTELVAAADVSHNRFSHIICASVVVWRTADGAVIETRSAVVETKFPYVPGLLSFREAPALLASFRKLKTVPDAVLIDGQGIAHPRRIGIASHMGLWLNRPTIGCAKTRLIGEYVEPDAKAGSVSPLTAQGDLIGQVVRTKTNVKPLFVSPGHQIDLAGAVRVVLATTRGRRMPVPALLAHEAANATRRLQGA